MHSFPLVVAALAAFANGKEYEACEWILEGTPPEDRAEVPSPGAYAAALKTLDMRALKADMEKLLTDSKSCWPADWGNYGPFFVRLAWHCSGTYRNTDGRGGCGGGRQRFEPERSWEDNTNLDKARALLYPLKAKYGDALSWGDLFITAGTTALRSMGTPITQLCFGRVDDADGTDSLPLGPTPVQERVAPCPVNGQCPPPLGASTMELIYVNAEGPVLTEGAKPAPDPKLSAPMIRDIFGRMGHDDRAAVALIGGGHAFGKCHGACPDGPGLPPRDSYAQDPPVTPWEGVCGSGKGKDTFTNGFEGPFTTRPLKWTNEFFKTLLDRQWEKHIGPGGRWQWRIKNATGRDASVMRLTTDLALVNDDRYLAIVKEFAADIRTLDRAFDDAWFSLVTNGGSTWSPASKCDSGDLPKALLARSLMLNSDLEESADKSHGKVATTAASEGQFLRYFGIATTSITATSVLAVVAVKLRRHGEVRPEEAEPFFA